MGLGALLNRSAVVDQVAVGPTGPPSLRDAFPGISSPRVLPQPVSERTALAVPAFWRGHALVCGGLGGLPVAAWRDTEQLDPQPPVLRQPDPAMTPMAFWAGLASAVTLYGNSVCIIGGTDRLGYPTALKAVHPLQAAARFMGNPTEPDIAGWFLAGRFYDFSEVWHVRSHIGRTGWPLGIGLIDGVTTGISAAQSLQDYQASFFASGAVPTGIVKVHRPEVEQEEADRLKSEWIRRFAGTLEPAVLNELTDFTPLAYNPVDSQMIEAAQMSLTQVSNMWGIPASKLGAQIGSGTYRNTEQEERQARNDGIAPWARLFEQAASLTLLPRGQEARWDLDAHLRADTLTRFQGYQIALGGPGPSSQWLLTDEVRGFENLDPITQAESDQVATAPAGVAADPLPTVDAGVGGPPSPNPAVATNGARHG